MIIDKGLMSELLHSEVEEIDFDGTSFLVAFTSPFQQTFIDKYSLMEICKDFIVNNNYSVVLEIGTGNTTRGFLYSKVSSSSVAEFRKSDEDLLVIIIAMAEYVYQRIGYVKEKEKS